jgi:hypothetical protein
MELPSSTSRRDPDQDVRCFPRRGGLFSIVGESMLDLCLGQWQWGSFVTELFSFSCQVPFSQCSILTFVRDRDSVPCGGRSTKAVRFHNIPTATKKFCAICGAPGCVTALTAACYLSTSCAWWIRCTSSNHTCLRFVLILSSIYTWVIQAVFSIHSNSLDEQSSIRRREFYDVRIVSYWIIGLNRL